MDSLERQRRYLSEADAETAHRLRVQYSRIWIQGCLTGNGVARSTVYLSDDTREEAIYREALAQLLVDGNAPQDILDGLAAVIAPNTQHTGSGRKTSIDLVPSHVDHRKVPTSDRILSFHDRSNHPKADPYKTAAILMSMSDKISRGMTIERACSEVSAELRKAFNSTGLARQGRDGLSEETIRRVWREGKILMGHQ